MAVSMCRFKCILDRLHTVNYLNLLHSSLIRHTSKSSTRNTYQNDAIDVYTENLVQENSNKWNEFIMKMFSRNPIQNFPRNDSCCNERILMELSVEELQSKIIDSVNNGDVNNVLYLVKFCEEKCYCLSSDLMLYLVKLFAKIGNKEGVDVTLSLYKTDNADEFTKKCGLKYYTAQALWYSGYIEESFEILEMLYTNNSLTRDVNFIVYDIICSSVVKSEASLVLLTNFVQRLVDKHNNYYPISILWKKLTESEWFADNQLAKQLLHNNKELIIVLSPLIPLWCAQLMQYHRVDAVHKMSEILLINNDIKNYSSVLYTLFDYYYNRKNLKMCSAVVKSALDLGVPLRKSYQQRFLVLLTTGKPDVTKQKRSESIPKAIEYQINLKF